MTRDTVPPSRPPLASVDRGRSRPRDRVEGTLSPVTTRQPTPREGLARGGVTRGDPDGDGGSSRRRGTRARVRASSARPRGKIGEVRGDETMRRELERATTIHSCSHSRGAGRLDRKRERAQSSAPDDERVNARETRVSVKARTRERWERHFRVDRSDVGGRRARASSARAKDRTRKVIGFWIVAFGRSARMTTRRVVFRPLGACVRTVGWWE